MKNKRMSECPAYIVGVDGKCEKWEDCLNAIVCGEREKPDNYNKTTDEITNVIKALAKEFGAYDD